VGKKQKFITVVSSLETADPLWFGAERRKETLDEFFDKQLSPFQRSAVRAACVDMWGAAKLMTHLVGESPTDGTCPVAIVAITGSGASDQAVGSPVVKVSGGWRNPGQLRQGGEQVDRL